MRLHLPSRRKGLFPKKQSDQMEFLLHVLALSKVSWILEAQLLRSRSRRRRDTSGASSPFEFRAGAANLLYL